MFIFGPVSVEAGFCIVLTAVFCGFLERNGSCSHPVTSVIERAFKNEISLDVASAQMAEAGCESVSIRGPRLEQVRLQKLDGRFKRPSITFHRRATNPKSLGGRWKFRGQVLDSFLTTMKHLQK